MNAGSGYLSFLMNFLIVALLVGMLARPAHGQAASDTTLLKTWIAREYPAVTRSDPWTQIQILREFSYRHTRYALNVNGRAYAAGTANVNAALRGQKSLYEAYRFFDANQGGVVCGGTAGMLMLLYQSYGYRSWQLGIGWTTPPTPSDVIFTHQQTLVEINYNGRRMTVLSDPSTNLTYTMADGRTPIDYLDLLRLLAQQLDSSISTTTPIAGSVNPTAGTILFRDDDAESVPRTWTVDPTDYSIQSLPSPALLVAWSRRTLTRLEALGSRWWHHGLDHLGLPKKTVYLELFPFNIVGSSGGGTIRANAKQVINNWKTINIGSIWGPMAKSTAINQLSPSYGIRFRNIGSPTFGVFNGHLYFNPDMNSNVQAEIRFGYPLYQFAFNVYYFGGGEASACAYTAGGELLNCASADSDNRVDLKSSRAFSYVLLGGNGPGRAALNIDNLFRRGESP